MESYREYRSEVLTLFLLSFPLVKTTEDSLTSKHTIKMIMRLWYSATVLVPEYEGIHPQKNVIIEIYRDDFPKYGGSRNLNRMLNVFNFAATNVGVKIKYSNISRWDQSVTIRKDIELLSMARVFGKVIHSHCSRLLLQPVG